jgi:hypothetical protein
MTSEKGKSVKTETMWKVVLPEELLYGGVPLNLMFRSEEKANTIASIFKDAVVKEITTYRIPRKSK